MKKLNIAKLALNTRKVEFTFPGMKNFKLFLEYQSRSELEKLREDSMISKMDEETGILTPELDTDAYVKNYVKRVIKGWKGFTYSDLSKLILIDESQVEDMNEEIAFDDETAIFLVQNSERFDNFVTQTIRKLDNFRNKKA